MFATKYCEIISLVFSAKETIDVLSPFCNKPLAIAIQPDIILEIFFSENIIFYKNLF